MFIHIGSFYSIGTAEFLKERISKDIPDLDNKKSKLKR